MNDCDVIGDIHGHADVLEQLLETLGYLRSGGVYRHPMRKAVFVGEFIDRGKQQKAALRIAREAAQRKPLWATTSSTPSPGQPPMA